MAIQETIVIELASVEATDDYRIELRQDKKRTTYSMQQARDLALELLHQVDKVDEAFREEMTARGVRLKDAEVRHCGEVVL